jgi:hypothetical protein
MPLPPERAAAADEPVVLRLVVNLDTASFSAFVSVPMSLRSVIERLPPEAEPVLAWLPDIVLDGVGVRFDPAPATESFGVYAAAGVTGSADGSADAFVVTLPGQPKGVILVAGLRLSSTVDLAGTPLFGSMLSGLAIQDLQVGFASADVKAGQVVLPPPAHKGRSPAYTKGLQLSFTIAAGDATEQFRLTPSTFRRPALGAPPADSDAPPVQWFPVQKSFGPLTLGRIGVLATAERFGLALDASVATKVLSIDLTGFVVSFDINDISPSGVAVQLDGLGVAFKSGAASLSGSLIRSGRSYDGSLLLQIGRFGVVAVGSYTTIGGSPSLFVFGMVKGQFGGPPAFFVTGLAAGFGYNRALRLPEPDQVQDFPLVLAARLGSGYLPTPNVAAALGKMSSGGWVPPELGSYWLALGVKFTSFQLIDSFVLLTVQFGNELVIAVLGIASLQLPKAAWGARPYAYVELVLIAVIRPAAGTVQVTALLTPNSFVIDKACKLTGGFAFYLWFGKDFTGDFVLTIGGYHDYFRKPDHYPVVPRLGISWTMSPELRLAGSAYFALTPSCVMGGGRLDIAFASGALRAWLRAYADFLMYWRPFFFSVRIGLVIGASYTLTIGAISRTFTVELGAEVELWGPPVAGVARVSWWVISFTIAINGGGRPPVSGKLLDDWDAFAASFLPPREEICKARADAGLAGTVPDGPGTMWLVSALELVLSSETAIPASLLIAGAENTPQTTFPGHQPGVYPLGSLKIDTRHRVEVYRLRSGQPDEPVDVSRWSWGTQESGLPESLWGTVNNGQPDLDARMIPGFTGLRGAPPPPARTGPGPMPTEALGSVDVPDGGLPLPDPPIDGATGRPVTDPRTVIAETVMAPEVRQARADIVAELNRLGLGRRLESGGLSLLAAQVQRTFADPPLLGPPGTTGPREEPAGRAGRGSGRRASVVGLAGGAAARSGPRLLAVFRWHGERVAASVFDRYAAGHERAALAGLAGRAGDGAVRLAPGASVVWDLPPGAARLAEADGPVLLAAFDPQFRLVGWVSLAAGGRYPVPEPVSLLVVTSPAAGRAWSAGWSAASALLQAGPQALLAPAVVIRPQVPARIRCGRATRPVGRIDGAGLVGQNWTETSAGPRRGWITSTVPAAVRSVTVTMVRDDGEPPDGLAEPPADSFVIRAGQRVALAPASASVSASAGGGLAGGVRLRYAVPAPDRADEPGCVLVAPRPGWHQHGLSADSAPDWLAGRQRPAATEVRLS